MIEVKAPGKLYLAGEYAVVEPGYPAVIVAVDQFVTANLTASPSATASQVTSEQFPTSKLTWFWEIETIHFSTDDSNLNFVKQAIINTEQYCLEQQIPLQNYRLTLDSQLVQAGKKYGLGSSAAVTVATIKAILKFYNCKLSLLEIFKIAALTHYQVQGNGSLGDVAASVYGGWIAYTSFDRTWLRQQTSATITSLLASDWPALKITPLTPPADLSLLIGWTGSPASSKKLVAAIKKSQLAQPAAYQKFLTASKNSVLELITGLQNGNYEIIFTALQNNRQALLTLSRLSGVEIETPLLNKLVSTALNYQISAKSSGAGGGDCGIALTQKSHPKINTLLKTWEANQIQVLPFKVWNLN
ncbi:phosphomevalonate kinase [Ligilactobacillus ceti]|uniref:phosphomevalonate kinase n=1 Tax=Ligilactobacillus ceti DSM 22408 TaxID=1122146 RepID=A0A0R2KH24_9LACO|nr:phosphomevalonate kinase [Ligilactobacillus ceti]KRN88657.1 phosphomevalonate kinase [Ligilactobacillus ceti DSM 22408]